MIVKNGNTVGKIYKGTRSVDAVYIGNFSILTSPISAVSAQIIQTFGIDVYNAASIYTRNNPIVVPYVLEDYMCVCSLPLVLEEGVTMPMRWCRMINGYWDTGLNVTMSNWNKIRYILDAVPTTTNRGNNWWANGIGGGSTCSLHVGLNNGTGGTTASFTYANGYGDITTGVYGKYNTHYRWDFDLKNATYKVYNEDGTLACDVSASLRAPTANNTSGGITIGRWHQYNNINSGRTHSADTREVIQYVDDELINWYIPFTRNGVFGMMNMITDTFAQVSGTMTEKYGWWENETFVEWTPPN